ncbi:hypothetical protein ADZ36_26425 [Streptomyces fradiae]|uniref:Uncharacterized protein n=3 Tax=Streptomyces TaxID=1883 RepID=A0A3R7ERD1_9ACTN|nr:hypothetical protein ADZ36_26425 [Streptomyces fradiae]OFA37737.1 hypothetical protein BEN35_28710 [Streptomyces fradiae]PQM23205.1 hypothetical protein Sfr7A_11455 [Streptomyces xinghaiensis]RKM94766.1 hypothetical protein SFRA_015915 [Streptomyces xinghaiensis]RNC74793.1 hypothetical protein DC095_009035 [Streptomyces xinghaiensis]
MTSGDAMEDRLEPDSALQRLSERIEGIEAGQGRHEEKLDGFRGGLHGVQADVGRLNSEVTNVRQEIAGLENAVADTRRTLDAFIEQYGRDREVSKAQAELSRLTTEWHANFAQRKQTRALARGLVHTLTAQAVYRNVVNTATVRACSEERLLLEPTYWLAPATMAVAARFRDEEEQGERARAHACALDAAKANLFFSLTCSRLGDETEAAAWMDLYLQSLDPNELGQDFFVVLDAIASKELGEKALGYAQQAMARWNRGNSHLSIAADTTPEMRNGTHLESRLLNLRSRITGSRYAALRNTCGDQWEALRGGWELATVPDMALAYLRRMFPDEVDGVETPVSSGGHVESALERLIDQLEPDEADVREKMRHLECIIEHEGDLEEARRAQEVSLAPDAAPVALMTLLDQAVFEPDEVQIGQPARLMALRAIWPGLEKAAQRFVAVSEYRLPRHITLSVAGWSCTVPTNPRLIVDAGPLLDELATHIEQQTQVQSDAVVRRWPRVVAALVSGAFTGALVVPFVDGISRWIFTLLTFGMVMLPIWEICSLPRRKKYVRDQGDRLRQEAATTLTKALRQRQDFFKEWHDAVEQLNSLIQWGGRYRLN